jgi:hypothetical protein
MQCINLWIATEGIEHLLIRQTPSFEALELCWDLQINARQIEACLRRKTGQISAFKIAG